MSDSSPKRVGPSPPGGGDRTPWYSEVVTAAGDPRHFADWVRMLARTDVGRSVLAKDSTAGNLLPWCAATPLLGAVPPDLFDPALAGLAAEAVKKVATAGDPAADVELRIAADRLADAHGLEAAASALSALADAAAVPPYAPDCQADPARLELQRIVAAGWRELRAAGAVIHESYGWDGAPPGGQCDGVPRYLLGTRARPRGVHYEPTTGRVAAPKLLEPTHWPVPVAAAALLVLAASRTWCPAGGVHWRRGGDRQRAGLLVGAPGGLHPTRAYLDQVHWPAWQAAELGGRLLPGKLVAGANHASRLHYVQPPPAGVRPAPPPGPPPGGRSDWFTYQSCAQSYDGGRPHQEFPIELRTDAAGRAYADLHRLRLHGDLAERLVLALCRVAALQGAAELEVFVLGDGGGSFRQLPPQEAGVATVCWHQLDHNYFVTQLVVHDLDAMLQYWVGCHLPPRGEAAVLLGAQGETTDRRPGMRAAAAVTAANVAEWRSADGPLVVYHAGPWPAQRARLDGTPVGRWRAAGPRALFEFTAPRRHAAEGAALARALHETVADGRKYLTVRAGHADLFDRSPPPARDYTCLDLLARGRLAKRVSMSWHIADPAAALDLLETYLSPLDMTG